MKTQPIADELCRAADIPNRLPHLFTDSQWEWAMRNRESNGLSPAIKKVGARYFVNISTLLEVIESSNS